jgi:prefoldin alpha subunit
LASKNEEELRRLSAEVRLLEQTAEAIQSRINMINAVMADLTYANMTLEGLEKETENTELLVPIGGNSHIKAGLVNPDKIIVGIGAGVSMEKTRQEAKEIIKNRLESTDKARMSLQQQLAQVAEKITEDREKFDTLIAELRGEKPAKNV